MHFYYTTISKIQDILGAKGEWDIIVKLGFLYPNGLKEVLFSDDSYILLYNFILAVIAFLGFVFFMNRRLDLGQ